MGLFGDFESNPFILIVNGSSLGKCTYSIILNDI